MNRIVPGILEKDWEAVEKKLESLKGIAKKVQIDFIDQTFENRTFLDPQSFKKYSDEFFLQAHLMVEDPISHLENLSDSGFKSFVGQIEEMKSQAEFIALGQTLGEVGLAIDLETELSEIKINIVDLDILLLMAVKAGRSGQEFDDRIIEKIRNAKNLIGSSGAKIEIDGGISDSTIRKGVEAGADFFVASSYLFQSEDIREQIEKLNLLIRD